VLLVDLTDEGAQTGRAPDLLPSVRGAFRECGEGGLPQLDPYGLDPLVLAYGLRHEVRSGLTNVPKISSALSGAGTVWIDHQV
jgi:hypothetical protein